MEQIDLLIPGNVIVKFPSFGGPVDVYDKEQKKYIEYYEIRSIKYRNEVFELVMTGESVFACSLPGDIGRIFIKSHNIINERVWWQDIPADHW